MESLPEMEARNQFLDENRTWTRAAESSPQKLDARAVINLPPEATELYNLMIRNNSGYYYYGITDFGPFLPMLAKFNIPIFLTATRNTFKERLQLIASPGHHRGRPGAGRPRLQPAGRPAHERPGFHHRQEQPADRLPGSGLGAGRQISWSRWKTPKPSISCAFCR